MDTSSVLVAVCLFLFLFYFILFSLIRVDCLSEISSLQFCVSPLYRLIQIMSIWEGSF